MKMLEFYNKTRNSFIARAEIADTVMSRLKGLLLRPSLQPGDGLYLLPCSQIHMIGMKFAIDALFLDRDGVVVGLCENLKPGQISPLFINANSCLELPPGVISGSGTCKGDLIEKRQTD